MSAITPKKLLEIRKNPLFWWQGFGRYRDEETRRPLRGRANILQRRLFEHYRRCQEAGKPCRVAILKYRRAGSSTASSCLMYMHAQNYNARLGVIGTDYRASSNMLDMVKYYGEHDDFPGWSVSMQAGGSTSVPWTEWYDSDKLDIVPFDERVDKVIATKLIFSHGSTVELYTSKNPESARSAGLSGYHATEAARWATGGKQDAGETLMSMRNTLPKKGFHVAIEESTANGAQGAFYETCRTARWPDYAEWPKQWQGCWPLTEQEFGKDLQFVFIFAAWFEDERHVPSEPLTPEQVQRIKDTLDEREKELISLYGNEGPKGLRLGTEVNATVWEQLAWRRGIIATVCTKGGADEFAQEYASNPLEAFRASGSPALDNEGLTVLEVDSRGVIPDYGTLALQNNGRVVWQRCMEGQSVFYRWEQPIVGARYLITVDPMSGAEEITNPGEKDRHSIFVLRDAMTDIHGRFHRLKVVARIRPPCQWENKPLARQIFLLSLYYGRCTITVESNAGIAILTELRDTYQAQLYMREEWDGVRQKAVMKLGWRNDEPTRRMAIAELQSAVREQSMELLCPHAIGEMKSLIVDNKGKVRGGGSAHDDDPLAIAIGLVCMPAATTYQGEQITRPEAPDMKRWKVA